MEVTPGFIYAISVLERIRPLLHLVFLVSLVVMIFSFGQVLLGERAHFKPFAKAGLIGTVASLLLVAFIPSGKTLAAMYVIPPIVNSSAVQELPSELVAVAREWLDELRPNRGKSK